MSQKFNGLDKTPSYKSNSLRKSFVNTIVNWLQCYWPIHYCGLLYLAWQRTCFYGELYNQPWDTCCRKFAAFGLDTSFCILWYLCFLVKWRHFFSPKTLLCFWVRVKDRVRVRAGVIGNTFSSKYSTSAFPLSKWSPKKISRLQTLVRKLLNTVAKWLMKTS